MMILPRPVAQTDDADALAQLLTVTRLDTIWQHDPRLDTGPSLCARIRGAWGRRLRTSAQSEVEATRAWAAFFPDKTNDTVRFGAAPPYRIAAWTDSEFNLNVSLRLIGFSGQWRRSAFDSLLAALAEPPGLRLAFGNPLMTSLKLLDATWTRTEGVSVPVRPARLVFDFKTPLRIGSDTSLSTDFGNVIVSIAQRAQAISPWIGLAFSSDLSRWREVAKATVFQADGLEPVTWETWSTANGLDRAVGYAGRLVVAAPIDEVTALSAAGTVLHAGGRPSKGYGRYDLFVEP